MNLLTKLQELDIEVTNDILEEVFRYTEASEDADIDDVMEILENIDDNGHLHQAIDGSVDVYNYTLREWSLDNPEYIERAVNEGLIDFKRFDYHALLMAAQYLQIEDETYEVLRKIKRVLKNK